MHVSSSSHTHPALDNLSEPASIYSIDTFTGFSKSLYSQLGTRNLAIVLD